MRYRWIVVGLVTFGSCTSSGEQVPAERQQLQAQTAVELSTDSSGLVPRVTRRAEILDLDGRFESAVTARLNPDGTVSIECHDDQPALDRALGVK